MSARRKSGAASKPAKGARVTVKTAGGGDIEKLVLTLDRLTRELLIAEGDDPNDRKKYELCGPPSKKDLAAHLKAVPDLPPSYVAFLRRHAGWTGFWGDCSLLGPRNAKNAKQWAQTLRDARNMDGYLDEDDAPDDPDFIRGAQIIPICFHTNNGMLGFDRRKPGKNGELQVVDLMRTNGCVDNRHASFAAFLRNRIGCTKGSIARASKRGG